EGRLPADEIDGHYLARLGCGVCQAAAYYRGPYAGGAVFLLITDPGFRPTVDEPLGRILTVFPEAISRIAIRDHRAALEGYLRDYGFDARSRSAGDAIVVEEAGKRILTATFDEARRLTRLEGAMSR